MPSLECQTKMKVIQTPQNLHRHQQLMKVAKTITWKRKDRQELLCMMHLEIGYL